MTSAAGGAICGGIGSATEVRIVYRRCRRCARRKRNGSKGLRRHRTWFESFYGWTAQCLSCYPDRRRRGGDQT